MMVSNKEEPGGQELINTVVSATGLPGDLVEEELESIIRDNGQAPGNITLDELREAMIAYLESTYKDLALLEETSSEESFESCDQPGD